nr:hypothetical protein [Tanacetum cinerariifolium]
RKHNFYLRPDSLLYLPNEEPVLGYLKFSAKGTKQEVFGMPIPDNLITADIQGIPKKEPRFDDEEAEVQRALEEILKSVYDAPRGPLPPVVIRESERTSTPTESSGHDESSSLYAKLGLKDSEVESDEDVLGIDAGVSDEGQAGPNPGEQDEGQAAKNMPKGQNAVKKNTNFSPKNL